MFEIGEFVVSANNGICEIKDRVIQEMSGVKKEYFLIVPIEESTAKVFIPIDKADSRMRKVISKDEALAIVDQFPTIEELNVANDKQREQLYKEAIASCDLYRLVSIIKSMYRRNQERNAQGKRNTVLDDRYYRIAEHNLYAELAFAVDIEVSDVHELVVGRFEDK